jgi:NitT/TauT family transport system substrate-binding protein
MRISTVWLSLLVALAMLLVACAPTASPPAQPAAGQEAPPVEATEPPAAQEIAPTATPEPEPEPEELAVVKVAYVPILNFAPLYVAVDRGFMAEQSIEVDMQRVTSGSEAMAFLAQGQLDAGGVGIGAAAFNGFSQGFDMRIVASAALQPMEDGPTVVVVRQELAESGEVQSMADLAGRKVAIAGGAGTTGAYFVARGLRDAGLSFDDIEVVNLGNPDIPQALENGAVDAGLVGPPYSQTIVDQGFGQILAKDLAPGAMTTVYMYSGTFINQRPEVAQGFMNALVKASRSLQGDGYLNDANIEAMANWTGTDPEVIRTSTRQTYDPDLTIYVDTIRDMEEIMRSNGWTEYSDEITTEQMVDSSFQEQATALLGAE